MEVVENLKMEISYLISFTSVEIAENFKSLYSKKFVFNNGVLYHYNGIYWAKDDKNFSILNKFIGIEYFNYLFNIFQEYDKKADKKEFKQVLIIRKNIEKLRNYSQRQNYLNEIINFITNNEIIWNSKPELFCFNNKLYNLDKNKFVNSKPRYYINMTCGYDYNDGYDNKNIIELTNLLEKIHSNIDIRNCYLETISTGLYGQNLEKFIIASGSGGNGKGVINELLCQTLGNYSYVLNNNVLFQNMKQGSNPEIANCNDKRMVIIREPDEKQTLNASIIKELTGGSEINARMNHSNDTKTNLKLTLLMECNEKPNISEVNDAIQRRIIDIPFNSIFTSQDKIDKLKKDNIELTNIFKADRYFKTDEFKNQYKQALFMVLIKHFKIFRDNNFNIKIPEIINVRTQEYMQNSDAFYNVIEENYKKTDSIKDIVPLKEIYNIFKGSEIYINSTKDQKRKMNYKNFIEKIKTNIFFRSYLKQNNKDTYILTNYILNETKLENDSDDNKIYDF